MKADGIGSTPSPTVSAGITAAWNARHPVGSAITYIDDSGREVETTVTAPCEPMAGARCAQIAARDGWCCIDRLI